MITKIMFLPVSILSGLVAGLLGKKVFERLWGVVDDQDPPDAKHRDVSWGKLLAALVLQGAVFKALRGLVDRATRVGFSRATGTWPGEARPSHG
jgi:Protein of unknown function (DUF4235)